MSRSYHITKRAAARRFATEGDVEALVDFAEKETLKQVVKKFRGIYAVIHPSDKVPNKLRGSVAQKAMKILTEGNDAQAKNMVAGKP